MKDLADRWISRQELAERYGIARFRTHPVSPTLTFGLLALVMS